MIGRRLAHLPAWCLVVAQVGALFPVAAEPAPLQQLRLDAAGWPLADFTLRDHQGKTFTSEQLLGHWTFVLLGDTQCGAPCSGALAALEGIGRRLRGTMKTPRMLFVSLAPERDTPAMLAAHLAAFEGPFVGATCSPQTLALLADELAPARPAAASAAGAGDARYTGSLFLIGPDGAIRAEFLAPFDVPQATASYLKLRLRG